MAVFYSIMEESEAPSADVYSQVGVACIYVCVPVWGVYVCGVLPDVCVVTCIWKISSAV